MTDTNMLMNVINESGLKLSYIAASMGLTYAGLRKKINNESEFKASEIVAITPILHLDKEMRDRIFLS